MNGRNHYSLRSYTNQFTTEQKREALLQETFCQPKKITKAFQKITRQKGLYGTLTFYGLNHKLLPFIVATLIHHVLEISSECLMAHSTCRTHNQFNTAWQQAARP